MKHISEETLVEFIERIIIKLPYKNKILAEMKPDLYFIEPSWVISNLKINIKDKI